MHGGKRKGAGRPKSKNKKVQLYVSMPTSDIKTLGGKDYVRELLTEHVKWLTAKK